MAAVPHAASEAVAHRGAAANCATRNHGSDGDVICRRQHEPDVSTAGAVLGALTTSAAVPWLFFVKWVAPRVSTWGATSSELVRAWPGDELVPDPGLVWTNAITVDRPTHEVWPWVTQIGQGRGGLYSYDWLENAVLADVHSVAEVIPQFQEPLAVGERVIRMTRYAPYNPVAGYSVGHALVLGGVTDSLEQLKAGRPSSTWAFIVDPLDDTHCRLVVRSRGRGLALRLQGPIQFVMQRKMMLGIKQRAEGTWAPSRAEVLVPVSWFIAAALAAVQARRALRTRPGWRGDSALAGLAGIGVEVLLFWDPAAMRRICCLGGMLAAMFLSRR